MIDLHQDIANLEISPYLNLDRFLPFYGSMVLVWIVTFIVLSALRNKIEGALPFFVVSMILSASVFVLGTIFFVWIIEAAPMLVVHLLATLFLIFVLPKKS
jgi:hypothetical protein